MTSVEPAEFAQKARWRSFRDPSAEARYREWHREQVLPVARVLAYFGVLFWGLIPVWWQLWVGESSRVLQISNWAIAVPLFVVGLIGSVTRFQQWLTEFVVLVNVALGLVMTWAMSTIYGPTSGTVAAGVLAMIFYPMVVRTPTLHAAVIMAVLTPIPLALQIRATVRGELAPADSWAYVAFLFPSAAAVVLTAAVIESGMRRQFVAESTLQASQRLIRRYVPEQVADAVLSGANETVEQHERRKLTIFFSDLVGFTDLSEELEPEDLASVLHDYFTEMNAIARRHGGTVDDLVGDAILVFFGAPERTDDRDQALRAVRMAVEMQEAMGPLNDRWASVGIPEQLTVRMGVNTGVVTVGNFGSEERTKYTALGKQVNIAARIQAQCQPGRVLISHPTWLLVHDEIDCTPVGELTLKGLTKPMPAYEVLPGQESTLRRPVNDHTREDA